MAKNNRTRGFSILTNRPTLYFIFFLSLVYLFNLLLNYDFPSILFFGLVGLVVSFFSKNMIIVLFFTLLFTGAFKWFGYLGNNEIVDRISQHLDITSQEDASTDYVEEEKVITITNFQETNDVNTEPLEVLSKHDKENQLVIDQEERIHSEVPNPELPIQVVLNDTPNALWPNTQSQGGNVSFSEVGLMDLQSHLSYDSI